MARLLDSLLGHEKLVQSILSAAAQNHLPHSLLFVGPSGIGKKMAALGLIQALMCQQPQAMRACGQCGSCLRIAHKNHEGLFVMSPDGPQIKIEQVRKLLDFLSLRAISKVRAILIDSIECLNPQSSNALLKILEEPPEQTYFLMIAPSSKHVLPTLRSRSHIVQFAPVPMAEMQKRVTAPEWALRASQGSFEKLHTLLDPDELSIRQKAIDFLQSWVSQPKGYLAPQFRELVRGRENALRLAQHLVFLFRDALLWRLGERIRIFNPDQIRLLEQLNILSTEQFQQIIERCLGIERALMANRDSQLVFEEFWIQTHQL